MELYGSYPEFQEVSMAVDKRIKLRWAPFKRKLKTWIWAKNRGYLASVPIRCRYLGPGCTGGSSEAPLSCLAARIHLSYAQYVLTLEK